MCLGCRVGNVCLTALKYLFTCSRETLAHVELKSQKMHQQLCCSACRAVALHEEDYNLCSKAEELSEMAFSLTETLCCRLLVIVLGTTRGFAPAVTRRVVPASWIPTAHRGLRFAPMSLVVAVIECKTSTTMSTQQDLSIDAIYFGFAEHAASLSSERSPFTFSTPP